MSFPVSKARRKQKTADTTYRSPKRPRNKRQTADIVYLGDTDLRNSLQARLNALLAPVSAPVPDLTANDQWMDVDHDEPDNLGAPIIEEPPPIATNQEDSADISLPANTIKYQRRIVPNSADYRLYNKWIAIIPTLVDDYIHYYNATIGKRAEPCPDEIYREECGCQAEKLKVATLTCLYHDCE